MGAPGQAEAHAALSCVPDICADEGDGLMRLLAWGLTGIVVLALVLMACFVVAGRADDELERAWRLRSPRP